jgi:hypothetical protein
MMTEKVDYGCATIRTIPDWPSPNGEVELFLTVTGAFSAAHDATGGRMTVSQDQAADLLCALVEHFELSREEKAEKGLDEILAAAGVSETPD